MAQHLLAAGEAEPSTLASSCLEAAPEPRLLFAVFQTGDLANGGVESISAVIEGLHRWSRIVVTNRETPVCARWRASGACVVVWDLPYQMGSSVRAHGFATLLRRAWSLVKTNLQVAVWARCGRMNVIHCNDPAPFWHLAPAAKLLGVPFVFNLRDTKSAEEGLDVAKYRSRFRLASRVLVISREMKSFYDGVFGSHDSRSEAINFIYSSVDFARMRPLDCASRSALRKRLGMAANTVAIGYIATFNNKKNQLGYLREAVPALQRALPRAKTYFVGDFNPTDDAYARECEGAVAINATASAVECVGYSPRIEEWYQACDLIVVPTRKEGLARCMIEGLACGTPVISFDVCSACEILKENECGLVVPSGDYLALVDAIRLIASDPEKLARMQSHAVATARTLFTTERMISQYQVLYTSLERPVR